MVYWSILRSKTTNFESKPSLVATVLRSPPPPHLERRKQTLEAELSQGKKRSSSKHFNLQQWVIDVDKMQKIINRH